METKPQTAIDLCSYQLELLRSHPLVNYFRGIPKSKKHTTIIVARAASSDCSDELVALFKNEFSLAGRLESVYHITPVALLGQERLPALIYNDYRATTLEKHFTNPLELETFLPFALQLVSLLEKLHAKQLIHGNLNLSNILIRENGELLLAEFGYCRDNDNQASRDLSSTIRRNLAYLAPEYSSFSHASIGFHSDFYSLGIIFSYLLTGALPYSMNPSLDTEEWVHNHISLSAHSQPFLVNLPMPIRGIILKLIQRDPNCRYVSAASLNNDLLACTKSANVNRVLQAARPQGELQISPKLYGRNEQLLALHRATHSSKFNNCISVVFIEGDAGFGKTTLLRKYMSDLATSGYVMGYGKFDEFVRGEPFSVVKSLLRYAIVEAKKLQNSAPNYWSARLSNLKHDIAAAVFSILPDVAMLLESTAPDSISELPNFVPSFSVFRRALYALIEVLTSASHPLVIILDDAQWIDEDTLEFLHIMLQKNDCPTITIILSARPGSTRTEFTESLFNAKLENYYITLPSLDLKSIGELLEDTFSAKLAGRSQIAELLQKKTNGNPFHLGLLLKGLLRKKVLYFDDASEFWQFNELEFDAIPYSENVARDILLQYRTLPVETQSIVNIMAAIGRTSDVAMIANVSQFSVGEVRKKARKAVEMEIIFENEDGFTFYHDLIYAVCKSMTGTHETQNVQFHVGQQLLETAIVAKSDPLLFQAIEHLSSAKKIDMELKEKLHFIENALIAARKARKVNSYSLALLYVDFALDIASCGLSQHCETIGEILLERAKCKLPSDLCEVEVIVAQIFKLDCSDLIYAEAYGVMVERAFRQSQYSEAIKYGRYGLSILGVNVQAEPTSVDCSTLYHGASRLLHHRFSIGFETFPVLDNKKVSLQLALIERIALISSFTSIDLFFCLTCHAIFITLKNGFTDSFCPNLAWFGVLVSHRFGLHQQGFEYAKQAHVLVTKLASSDYEAKVLLALEQVSVWTTPLTYAMECSKSGFALATRDSDVTTASFFCCHQVANLYTLGSPLDRVLSEINWGLQYAKKVEFKDVITIFRVQEHFVNNLMQDMPLSGFSISEIEGAYSLEDLNESMPTLQFWYWLYRGISHFMAKEFTLAEESLLRANSLMWSAPAHIHILDFHFYSALLYLCSDSHKLTIQERLNEASIHSEKLQLWAVDNPSTFDLPAKIVSAELLCVKQQYAAALMLYDEIFARKDTENFIHYLALAYERASEISALLGQQDLSWDYRANAKSCYLQWGAKAKVAQLERSAPNTLCKQQIPQDVVAYLSNDAEHITMLALGFSEKIQALEPQSNVAEQIILILVNLLAAKRGALIKIKGESATILSLAVKDERGACMNRAPNITSEHILARTLIHTAVQTHNITSIDTNKPNLYELDPFVDSLKNTVLIAVPILMQGKARAAFQLEFSANSFYQSRVFSNLLKLIALHTGPAIENSRLLSELTRSNSKLADSQKELKRIQTSKSLIEMFSNAGSWRLNVESKRVNCSPELTRILTGHIEQREFSFAQIAGFFHYSERNYFAKKLLLSMNRGEPLQAELRLTNPAKDPVYVAIQGGLISREKGVVEYTGMVMDMTSRVKSEQAMRQAQLDVARVSRATTVGQLSSTLSHEISQPLMSIVTNASAGIRWLRRDKPDLEQAMTSLENILSEGNRAGDIVQSIRALTKNSTPEFTPLNVHKVIQHIVKIVHSEIIKRDVALVLQLDSPQDEIYGDSIQLQQVFLNLIMNSIEAMHTVDGARKLIISTNFVAPSAIRITVDDSGIGFSDNEEQLFRSFYTTKINGMGMGLNICKSIVVLHNGEIDALTKEDGGSRFQIFLPLFSNLP